MGVLRNTLASSAPCSTFLIRLVVGGTFLSEGIQKFLYPNALGMGRFVKIGIPYPMAQVLSGVRKEALLPLGLW